MMRLPNSCYEKSKNETIINFVLISSLAYENTVINSSGSKEAHQYNRELGFSIIELMTVLLIISLSLSSVFSNIKIIERPLHSGTQLTMGFFRQVKAKAISSTAYYVIYPDSASRLATKSGPNCELARESLIEDTTLTLHLPNTVTLANTAWDLCYSSRGFLDNSITISLNDQEGKTRTLETFVGGAIRKIESLDEEE